MLLFFPSLDIIFQPLKRNHSINLPLCFYISKIFTLDVEKYNQVNLTRKRKKLNHRVVPFTVNYSIQSQSCFLPTQAVITLCFLRTKKYVPVTQHHPPHTPSFPFQPSILDQANPWLKH